MALVIDAVPGSATANSYNSTESIAVLAEEAFPYPTAWLELGSEDQARIAVAATRWLEQLECAGYRASSAQALNYPRDGVTRDGVCYASDEIPAPILRAHATLCFFLADCQANCIDPWSVPADNGVTAIELGDELRMTFAAAATNRRQPVQEFYSSQLSMMLGGLAWVRQAEAVR